MSDDIIEAIGAIIGIAFAGVVLYMIGAEMPNQNLINLQFIGAIIMILAVLAAALFLYTTISTVFRR